MARILFSPSAADELADDPQIRQWKNGKLGGALPVLSYFQRSYSTSHDGTVTEHGDGFALTFVDSKEISDTETVSYQNVTVTGGLDIIVEGPKEVMSDPFTIGWSKWKFTREISPTT